MTMAWGATCNRIMRSRTAGRAAIGACPWRGLGAGPVHAKMAALVLATAAALAPGVSLAQGSRATTDELSRTVDVVPQVADFAAPLLDGDGSVRLSDLRGKVVLLNFWASWCAPCLYEMPHFQTLYDRFKGQGLEVVAVAVMDKQPRALAFHNKHKFTFRVLFDSSGDIAKLYGFEGPPQTYLLGRNGKPLVIPNPRTGERQFAVIDPTIWNHPSTYAYLEGILKQP